MSPYQLKLDVDAFLRKHWQREHLFIPQGFEKFQVPADANELAGLAMEPEIDGRIVSNVASNVVNNVANNVAGNRGGSPSSDSSNIANNNGSHWQQSQGPFTEESYERMGPWTLLVQSVDQHWDEAAALLQSVTFLPNWRLDDIMMSYATDSGSAGPHFDNYDVFIIQGEGQRRWQIGGRCDASSELLDAPGLKLLKNFQAEHEYLMSTGDVLYIPPGVAHYGVSVGESTSFSIGFRAPRQSDLLARWTDNRLNTLEDHVLFRDPRREPATRSGEITAADLERARDQLLKLLDHDDLRWFGEAVTDQGTTAEHSFDDVAFDIDKSDGWITRAPGSRLAWHVSSDGLLVFAQGGSQKLPVGLQALVESLCDSEDVALNDTLLSNDGAAELLRWLHEEGVILFYD